jgi:hypothetical protein
MTGVAWTGPSRGDDVRVGVEIAGADAGFRFEYRDRDDDPYAVYDDYSDEVYYGGDLDAEIWVDAGYGRTIRDDRIVAVHIRPLRPSYILLYGVTPWGELTLLYPHDPYDVLFTGPAVLHVALPYDVHAGDVTIFAVASPVPVLPVIPRYLVPASWWHAGFRHGHSRWALDVGFVVERGGRYWIHGDPYRAARLIHREFHRGGRRHHEGRIHQGYVTCSPGETSHFSWARPARHDPGRRYDRSQAAVHAPSREARADRPVRHPSPGARLAPEVKADRDRREPRREAARTVEREKPSRRSEKSEVRSDRSSKREPPAKARSVKERSEKERSGKVDGRGSQGKAKGKRGSAKAKDKRGTANPKGR